MEGPIKIVSIIEPPPPPPPPRTAFFKEGKTTRAPSTPALHLKVSIDVHMCIMGTQGTQ
jgi:hypothetical protein